MKVTFVEHKETAPSVVYPVVMRSKADGTVVLFAGYGVGTVLIKGRAERADVGDHCTDWAMSNFWPVRGIITVEND